MIVEVVDPSRPSGPAVQRAAELLRAGGLVAFPTETVYGLGANALDERAVERIFEAKERPAYNPLIVHIGTTEAARELVTDWPETAGYLASRFWPGPLTFVLSKRSEIPNIVTAGRGTVAIRVPHHPVALALLRAARVPVAAPSANLFTRLSPTTAEHVREGLGTGVDMILDAGPTPVGIESTVLDLTGERPRLLRPGTISKTALEAVVGEILTGAGAELPLAGEALPSPGMVRQHYSPRAELRLFGEEDRHRLETAVRRAVAEGRRVGGLLRASVDAPLDHVVAMPAEPGAYAARLYSALHELDGLGCSMIVVDALPDDPEWAGVRDRLWRAAQAG